MAESIASLFVSIRATADQLAGDIVRGVSRAQGTIQARAVALGNLMSAGIQAGLRAGLSGIQSAIGQAMDASKVASSFEQTGVAFETLLGDAGKAKAMIGDMRKLAAASPLEFSDVSEAGKVMLAFGASAESIMPSLQALGDISLGNGERFKSLALAFSQTQAAGRLMGQEVLQFVNAGFNPLQQIALKTGESMADLKKRMEDGKIPFSEVAQAIKDATSEGGRFFGAMEKGSQTFEGTMAKLRDGWASVQAGIGQGINDALKPVINDVSKALDQLEPQARAVGQMFAEWAKGLYAGTGGLEGMVRKAVEFAGDILDWKQNFIGFRDLVISGAQVIAAALRTIGATVVGGFIAGKAAAVEMFELIKVKWQEAKAALSDLPKRATRAINRSATVAASGGGALGIDLGKLSGVPEPDLPAGEGSNDNSLLNPAIDYTAYNKAVEDRVAAVAEAGKAIREEAKGIGEASESAYEAMKKLFSNPAESTAGADLLKNYDSKILANKFGDAMNTMKDQASSAWSWVADLYRDKSNDIVKTTVDTAKKTTAIEKASTDGKAALLRQQVADTAKAAAEQVKIAQQAAAAIAQANEQTYEQFRSTNRGAVTDMVTAWATGTGKISDVIAQWSHRMIAQFAELALWGNKKPDGTGGSISGLLSGLMSSGTKTTGASSGGGWIQAAGAILGGFFADGGRPPMGKVSVVGERGPELFVPDSAGTIIPNNRAAAFVGGGGGAGGGGEGGGPPPIIINMNITSGVTAAELAGSIDSAEDRLKAAVAEGVERGGGYRRRMQR